MAEVEQMFDFLSDLGVDGHTISPGYEYDAAKKDMIKRLNLQPENFFLTRQMTIEKFKKIEEWMSKYTFFGTPIYFEFLAGKRDLTCSAWAIPTRNIARLERPVLSDDGRALFQLPGAARQSAVGQIRRRKRRREGQPLRELHGALRLRADRQPRPQRAARRYLEEDAFQLRREAEADRQRQRDYGIQRSDLRQRASHGQEGRARRTGFVTAGMGNPSANIIALSRAATEGAPRPATNEELVEAISLAQGNLLHQQKPDGHWIGELMVDSTLCSDYVLFMHWLGEVDETLQRRCVKHILKRQLPDGGWNIYYGGPSEINACVKAYFALKLAGHSPEVPVMREARANILRLGGIPRMNTYSKLYLALLGQFPWKYLPAIPVEMVLLPNWCFFNIYKMSSWSRAMLLPLAIINHFKPTRDLPEDKQLHELYPVGTEGSDFTMARDQRLLTWRNFFLRADRALKLARALAQPAAPAACARGGGTLDGRANRGGERWAGGGFPCDAQLHHRPARARLSEGSPALRQGAG